MAKAKYPHNSKRPESKAVVTALEKADIDALALALSPRQRRFSEEYVIDFNGTAACIRAGYATTYADRQAHLLLKHRGVSAYIDHLSRSKEAKIISVNPDYVIQKVTAIVTKDGAKDSDRLRGLELLARHLGMFVDRTEITGKDGEAIQIAQQRVKEEADNFISTIRRIADKPKKDVKLV